MIHKFDLIVIGTGAAGSTIASECRSAGREVAIVDSRPFGGTCALRGCDPKKVLLGAAEIVDWARRMSGNGIRGEQPRIDWAELMRFKRTFTDSVPGSTEQRMRDSGIVPFHGLAQFIGAAAVRIGNEVLEGRNIAVASGAKPAELNIPGVELLTTSDVFLGLDALPKRLVFVGGGYIAFEFAHIAARAGADVAIVHRDAKPLVRFDSDLVDQLVQATRELGVKFHLEAEVTTIARSSDGLRVHASSPAGERVLAADMVVHAAGRVPDIDSLDLQAAGIEWTRRGIKVNDFLQSTSNPAVYAAGDSADSGPPLTPVAGYEGRIVAQNLIEANHLTTDYSGVPSVVFSVPPLASVGLRQTEARERGLRFRCNTQDTSNWYSSRRIGQKHSVCKVLIEDGTDRILGAHLLGHGAEEVINLFALAIRRELTASDLREMLYSYPTHASDVRYML